MHQNTAPTCPAPRTATQTASADGVRITYGPGAADPAAVLAQLGAGSAVDLATSAPATPGSPAEPPALRKVPVSCRCEQYLRGEPAPSEPLALVRMAKTEADAIEHLHRATCHCNAIGVRVEEVAGQMARGLRVPDAEALGAALGVAYDRQREIERMTAQRWGVCLDIRHDI